MHVNHKGVIIPMTITFNTIFYLPKHIQHCSYMSSILSRVSFRIFVREGGWREGGKSDDHRSKRGGSEDSRSTLVLLWTHLRNMLLWHLMEIQACIFTTCTCFGIVYTKYNPYMYTIHHYMLLYTLDNTQMLC